MTSALFFVVLGVGMGFLMQITSLIVQNSVEQKDMGVASSSRAFFQQIGGSMGVSLFGVIFIHRLCLGRWQPRCPVRTCRPRRQPGPGDDQPPARP